MTALLIVQPDELDPLDAWSESLASAGLAWRTIRPYAGDALPPHLAQDGLIVLGGRMSANDDDVYPWLNDIRSLFRDAARQSKPALGICLGGQIAAQTFGGQVATSENGLEAGVVRLTMRSPSGSDPLFAGLPRSLAFGTMHGDHVVELPPGASWIAESAACPHQAFRVTESTWGLQFHPEITLRRFRSWVEGISYGDRRDNERLRTGLRDFEAMSPLVRGSATALAQRFAELVLRQGTSNVSSS